MRLEFQNKMNTDNAVLTNVYTNRSNLTLRNGSEHETDATKESVTSGKNNTFKFHMA